MKKCRSMVLLLLCVLLLTACGGGNIHRVVPVVGSSELYTGQEVEAAMDIVLDYFKKEFDGSTLIRLEYDESKVLDMQRGWAEQYAADQAIVLLSDFAVDASGGDGSLNPGDTYRNWQWILTRNGKGEWELQTWGYG